MSRTILVIDDEENMRWVLERALAKAGYEVLTAGRGEDGLRLFAVNPVDLVLLDLKMRGMDGLAVLRELRRRDKKVPVLLLTAYASVPTAVEAMQVGASDYLRKPFDLETVLAKVNERLAQRADFTHEVTDKAAVRSSFADFIGSAGLLAQPMAKAQAAVDSPYPVCIVGEEGSGRRHLARLIHAGTEATASGRLVEIDCAALPTHLLRRELSHEEDTQNSSGRWQQALGGSLLVANVESLSDELMSEIMGPLSSYLRDERRPHGLRLLLTAEGSLPAAWIPLQDSMLTITLPPLRARTEDLLLLVASFTPGAEWTADALARLLTYDWPGNVGELKRMAEQAARAAAGKPVETGHLPSHLSPAEEAEKNAFVLPSDGIDLEAVEESFLRQALTMADGNKTQAARLLSISRATLLYRLDKYKIDG